MNFNYHLPKPIMNDYSWNPHIMKLLELADELGLPYTDVGPFVTVAGLRIPSYIYIFLPKTGKTYPYATCIEYHVSEGTFRTTTIPTWVDNGINVTGFITTSAVVKDNAISLNRCDYDICDLNFPRLKQELKKMLDGIEALLCQEAKDSIINAEKTLFDALANQ